MAAKSSGGVGDCSSSEKAESDDFSDDEPDMLFETEPGVSSEPSSGSLELGQVRKGAEATRGGAVVDAVGCQPNARAARGERQHALRRSSEMFDAVMDTLAAQVTAAMIWGVGHGNGHVVCCFCCEGEPQECLNVCSQDRALTALLTTPTGGL